MSSNKVPSRARDPGTTLHPPGPNQPPTKPERHRHKNAPPKTYNTTKKTPLTSDDEQEAEYSIRFQFNKEGTIVFFSRRHPIRSKTDIGISHHPNDARKPEMSISLPGQVATASRLPLLLPQTRPSPLPYQPPPPSAANLAPRSLAASKKTETLEVSRGSKQPLPSPQPHRLVCIPNNQHQQPFTDPNFPPADSSLYIDPSCPCSKWGVYQWLRPSRIIDPHSKANVKWTVFQNPGPEDIVQGTLGNCWFLSALAVVAEQPKLLENILLTRTYSKEGAYQVRLCKDGNWQTILVDDCLPCSQSKEMVFSKAQRKQLWVPLIEKAVAKLYGSYEALCIGRVICGLSALTGLPCEKIFLRKLCGEADIDLDFIWAQLLSFRESSWPMGAMCGVKAVQKEDYIRVGLQTNHAYSILDVHCLEGSLRLIRLRNPWGKFSWKGKWSDGDPVWKSRPGLRKELQGSCGGQGIFWMEFTDFMRYFSEVGVCKYREHWHSTRVPGCLPNSASSQYSLLAFTVNSTTEVDVSLYQPSTALAGFVHKDESSGVKLVDLAFLVLRCKVQDGSSLFPVSCEIASGCQIETIVSCSSFLEAGCYIILPLSFNHWDIASKKVRTPSVMADGTAPPDSKPCVVALHTSKEVQYHNNVQTRPGFLAESIFLLASRTKSNFTPFPGMYLVDVWLKHSCRIVVAVNESALFHFTVSCNTTGSAKVFSTRGEPCTADCIPPMHRQVVVVLTQMESTQPCKFVWKAEFRKSLKIWGAKHTPPLFPAIQELHSPRRISK